ncbi:MAG: hypothetical protein AB7H80_13365 [Candidatus Kapaibacterium sp.]
METFLRKSYRCHVPIENLVEGEESSRREARIICPSIESLLWVHLGEGDTLLTAECVNLREDLLDQMLPLLLMVAEGGGDEEAEFVLLWY